MNDFSRRFSKEGDIHCNKFFATRVCSLINSGHILDLDKQKTLVLLPKVLKGLLHEARYEIHADMKSCRQGNLRECTPVSDKSKF